MSTIRIPGNPAAETTPPANAAPKAEAPKTGTVAPVAAQRPGNPSMGTRAPDNFIQRLLDGEFDDE